MKKLAVLIDADNVSATHAERLFKEIAKQGVASVKRAYGDWSQPHLKSWQDILLAYAITPIHQFAYTKGKNATDMQLIIDAMDLLYSNTLDGFCIVSSDSDYTPLASRIRTAGMVVYGFGRAQTPQALQQVCNTFIILDSHHPNQAATKKETTSREDKKSLPSQKQHAQATSKANSASVKPKAVNKHLRYLIYKGLLENQQDNSPWVAMSTMGKYLMQKQAGFDVKRYGYNTLSTLLLDIPAVEVRKDSSLTLCKLRLPHNLDICTLSNQLGILKKDEDGWIAGKNLLDALSTRILITRDMKNWLSCIEILVAMGQIKERYDAANKLYFYQAQ